jgi:hypothetical protein
MEDRGEEKGWGGRWAYLFDIESRAHVDEDLVGV